MPPAVRREPVWQQPALRALPSAAEQARAAPTASVTLVLSATLAGRLGGAERQLPSREALDGQRPGRVTLRRDRPTECQLRHLPEHGHTYDRTWRAGRLDGSDLPERP